MSKNKILKQWHIQRDDCKHDIALVSLDVAADERESVANLIAAAPAMYEALKLCKAFIDHGPSATRSAARCKEVYDNALAQAEGSKP